MMSENSFLVNMKENLKRRKGIAVLYSVLFLLIYPIGLTLFITSTKGYAELNPNYREDLTESFAIYFGMNIMTALFITLLAVICAIQGFSYLFKRQKLDMYMSVPVSKGRRFVVVYLNGILLYALPYLLSILLGICIGAGNGVYVGRAIKTLIFSYLSYLLYYLAIYNTTIIVVMLTGNTLLALCGAGIFLLYEGAVRLVLGVMNSIFFATYCSYTDEIWYKMDFSPALFFISEFLDSFGLEGQTVPYLLEKFGFVLIKIAAIAVIAGIAGYLLYAVRPAESCTKAIAFPKIRPVIKVMLMVPLSLMTGILFYVIANSTAVTILGFILGIFLSHGVLEVIFEFDLKAMFGSFRSMLVGAVFVFGIFAVFEFDLTGYDKWVPKPEQVESVAISSYSLANNAAYDFEKGYYLNSERYALEHMEITDVDNFCAFVKSVVESGNDKAGNKGNAEGTEERELWFIVKYRMKNGKEKYRGLKIPYEAYKEELNGFLSSEEYQKGAFQIMDEELEQKASLVRIRFNNGITIQDVEEADIEKVLQAYKEDFSHYDMETVAEQYPVGTIEFMFFIGDDPAIGQYDNIEQIMYHTMPIYANFEQTVAYAEEKNLLEDWKQSVYDIECITINHFSKEYGEWINKSFTKPEEIEAIFPALIPRTIENYIIFREDENSDYFVYISYQGKETDGDYESGHFAVVADLLPDFAK